MYGAESPLGVSAQPPRTEPGRRRRRRRRRRREGAVSLSRRNVELQCHLLTQPRNTAMTGTPQRATDVGSRATPCHAARPAPPTC
ncbi:hypothetical protein INR49_032506 [Caranx melampygus]|nr:hypothetical protein INR49_032506 [Caranx melampygus]